MTTVKAGFKPRLHHKCRGKTYPRDEAVQRFQVPDEKVPWAVEFPEYKPTDYTSESVLKGPVWADLDHRKIANLTPSKWNSLDGLIDRRSHTGTYEVVEGVPRNPVGRTGVCGRGCLGRWGPNHAADPIVTRWKRDIREKVVLHPSSSKPILQFIAIQRRDSGEWAIPGGMVDPGERVSATLRREFSEEAMNCLQASPQEREQIAINMSQLFETGEEVFRGYVDDPRNTDNSWMETVAVNFHDDSGTSVGRFKLHAGDDAVGVKWQT